MSGTPTYLFAGGAAFTPAETDLASAAQAVIQTARVSDNARKVAEQAASNARVEKFVATKAKEASDAAKVPLNALIGTQLEALIAKLGEDLKKRGLTIEDLGINPCTWLATKSVPSVDEKAANTDDAAAATEGVLSLPSEVFGEISDHLSVTDLNHMRLANKRIKEAVSFTYGKKISVTENITIFPTFASVAAFLIGIGLDDAYPERVRTITLIGEGPAAPEFSYRHSWDHVRILKLLGISEPTEEQWYEDAEIVEFANDEHQHWSRANHSFCHTGAYRTMLSLVLAKLPNLKTIQTRKLYPGEHIPGWAGPQALKKVSFYHPRTAVNEVYYADWNYDEKHKRVTMWTDEYGEVMEEVEDVGPQVGFKEDLAAAMALSGTQAQALEMHKELRMI